MGSSNFFNLILTIVLVNKGKIKRAKLDYLIWLERKIHDPKPRDTTTSTLWSKKVRGPFKFQGMNPRYSDWRKLDNFLMLKMMEDRDQFHGPRFEKEH